MIFCISNITVILLGSTQLYCKTTTKYMYVVYIAPVALKHYINVYSALTLVLRFLYNIFFEVSLGSLSYFP